MKKLHKSSINFHYCWHPQDINRRSPLRPALPRVLWPRVVHRDPLQSYEPTAVVQSSAQVVSGTLGWCHCCSQVTGLARQWYPGVVPLWINGYPNNHCLAKGSIYQKGSTIVVMLKLWNPRVFKNSPNHLCERISAADCCSVDATVQSLTTKKKHTGPTGMATHQCPSPHWRHIWIYTKNACHYPILTINLYTITVTPHQLYR